MKQDKAKKRKARASRPADRPHGYEKSIIPAQIHHHHHGDDRQIDSKWQTRSPTRTLSFPIIH
ncbi:hypothetical protein CPC08DRAFT_315772 [Agrocybe pediades]|nr:hypothetical protein CPC08DRAFT_315772 [Agrocybe pediades]